MTTDWQRASKSFSASCWHGHDVDGMSALKVFLIRGEYDKYRPSRPILPGGELPPPETINGTHHEGRLGYH
jgi:hypothetical protein